MKKEMQRRLREMQMEQQKREFARRYLTTEAYERLMNVRISNRELYTQLTDIIIGMVQGRRLVSKLTEQQLKDILARLTSKPEPTITFQHK